MALFDFLNQANPKGRDAGSIARQRLDARNAFRPPTATPGPTPGIPTSTISNVVGLQGLLYANQQLQPLLRSLNIGYDVTKDPRVQAGRQIGKNYKVGGIEYDFRTGQAINPPTPVFSPAKQQPGSPVIDRSGPGGSAAERAFEAEKSRVAQLTAQDPELQRYENARKAAKTQEEMNAARDIGMQVWQEKYGKTPMAQPGGAVGVFNPLMDRTFGYQTGSAPGQQIGEPTLGPSPLVPQVDQSLNPASPNYIGGEGAPLMDFTREEVTPEVIAAYQKQLLQQASAGLK